MSWSLYGLSEFLFGARKIRHLRDDGAVAFITEKLEYHFKEVTTSGFFSFKDAENISCVIANPGGTIAKFERIGLQAGFGNGKTKIVRGGFCLKAGDNPGPFTYIVGEDGYTETWIEGLSVFHNPNALHPLPITSIPAAAHFYVDNEELVGHAPGFHPIGSTSFVIHATDAVPSNSSESWKFIEDKLSVKFKDS